MPVIGTSRKHYSELVKHTGNMEVNGATNYYYARVDTVGADDVVEPIGIPVIWNGAAFEVYIAQDIDAVATDSTLPDGAPCAVIVGPKEGKGLNEADITLVAGGTEVTTLFRGEASIANEGMDWGTADANAQTAFKLQIEKQGIAVITAGDSVDPTYIS